MKHILLPIVLMTATAAHAQVNSPENDGFIARGRLMYDQGNYSGCIDQLSALDRKALAPQALEAADWLTANASYHMEGAAARPQFRAFVENHPYSALRQSALLRMADCILDTDPAAALREYEAIDAHALNDAEATGLLFHTAYARIMTGDTDKALPTMMSLCKSDTWGNEARYYTGYIYYTRHDYNNAGQYLSQVARGSRLGAFADFYRAQMAYTQADYDRALASARPAARNQALPADHRAEATRIEGEALFHLGKRKAAAEALNRYVAAVTEPALPALYLLGLEEYRNGNRPRAIELLQPVTHADDAMAQTAYLYIGEALMADGNVDAAILAFDNARRMDHDEAVKEAATYNYAVARTRGASVPFASGVEVYEDYLRRFPSGAHAHAVQEYIVKGYLTENNYAAALTSIERMTAPSEAVLAAKQQILYALGTRGLATGDIEAADRYLTRSRELSRHSVSVAAQAALSLGEVRYRQGRHDEAVALLNEYLRSTPETDANRALARYDLGYARLALKDYADAAVNFGKVAEHPGDLSDATVADALNRLGDTYYYRSDWDQAARNYDLAYRRNPSAGDYPLFQKAVMLGYRRDHKGKIASMQAMMEQFPTSSLLPDAMLEITESHQQLGQPGRAIEVYRRLAADYPTTVQGRRARLQLALTLANTGRRDEASKAYRDVISLYPTSEEAVMAADELKRLAADEGTLGEFADFLASIDNAPHLDVAEADRLEFEAAEKIWLTTSSADRLEKYLDRYPDGSFRPQALAYMAGATASTPARALQYTSEIITKYPDSPVAEKALEAAAQAHASLGMGDEAMSDWQALARRASTPQALNTARTGIMRVARDMSRADIMRETADALLSSSTTGSEVRTEAIFTRGLANSLDGHLPQAREDWGSIAGETADLYGTKAAFYLAESYYSAPRPDLKAARTHLERLIDSATPHTYWLARAFILLSDINAAEGNTFEAREYLRSLRENYPGDEPDIIQQIDTRLSKLK